MSLLKSANDRQTRELLQRIEKLEKENEELRKRVKELEAEKVKTRKDKSEQLERIRMSEESVGKGGLIRSLWGASQSMFKLREVWRMLGR